MPNGNQREVPRRPGPVDREVGGERPHEGATTRALAALRDLDRVLGVLPDIADELEADLMALIDARVAARAARDWAASDRLRDDLAARGVLVEDTRDGQRWRRGAEVQGG